MLKYVQYVLPTIEKTDTGYTLRVPWLFLVGLGVGGYFLLF